MARKPDDQEPAEDMLQTVNRSGFPLQIAVESLVMELPRDGNWRMRYSEHGWRMPDGSAGGFIDVVIGHRFQSVALVVECKRMQDYQWVFIQEGDSAASRRRILVPWVWHARDSYASGSHQITVDPPCTESRFCVVKGPSAKSQPTLERIAGELLQACDCLALEDLPFIRENDWPGMIYVPLIVTTAELHVCAVEPSAVTIADGRIPDAAVTVVPYVRFHKQLSLGRQVAPSTIKESGWAGVAKAKENTVFVVNASHLAEFLAVFDIDEHALGRDIEAINRGRPVPYTA